MAMNFFEHQEQARRRSWWLVVLFICAVIAIILMTYTVIAVVLTSGAGEGAEVGFWHPGLFLFISGVTILIVGGASLYRTASLSVGGSAVASSLGGRLVNPMSSDPDERRLLNIVEEMAIASGLPVPPVYIMDDEPGINAFAAGNSPSDAVVGVTRGALNAFSRDEMQGVMAHEFSHIFNGDMKLNIRLMGVLYGILVIGLIGQIILRGSFYASMARRRDKNNSAGAAIAIGLGLMIVGFAGTFFGNLIKAAVSRQREFLADASAVQFTRNPGGIGGALKKIRDISHHSVMLNPAAQEASHMFFGQSFSSSLNSLFATHPPIQERIERVLPGEADTPASASPSIAQVGAGGVRGSGRSEGMAAFAGGGGVSRNAAVRNAVESIGRVTEEHVAYAGSVIAAIPEPLRSAAHEPFAARAVIFALMLDAEPGVRQRQVDTLIRLEGEQIARLTVGLHRHLGSLAEAGRLPLIDMAIGSLRQLSPEQYRVFRRGVHELMAADKRLSLFEWMLQRMILRHLEPAFTRAAATPVRYKRLADIGAECALLLASLAWSSHYDVPDAARSSYEAAWGVLGLPGGVKMPPVEACSLTSLDDALKRLNMASPSVKRSIISAAAACITADHEVTASEAELLRAVSDALECPMPPILPGPVAV